MSRREHTRTIHIIATAVALILVLIVAPCMEGSRIIFGIPFTTKTGTPGLTNLGWGLFIVAPVAAYVVTGRVLGLMMRKGDEPAERR